MKTAGYYFKELLRIIIFWLLIAWLVSCNGNQRVINQIHSYSDSLGITKMKIGALQYSVDSIKRAYSDKYIATAFDVHGDAKQRAKWRLEEQAAYHSMLISQRKQESIVLPERIRLQVRCLVFQCTIDSLKLELHK